jgi:drug/metabolite transporter (DMT)-like permease
MAAGVAWALVAAVAFGFTQILNRKANLLVDAYRTAFGLLAVVELILIGRLLLTGELRLLAEAPVGSLALFSLSALIHYIGGWTFLALSQQKIGVARTGALVSSAPIVAALLAVPVLGEPLTPMTFAAVLVSVGGLVVIALSQPDGSYGWSRPWFALLVALCWGTGPMLIRKGLEGLDEPLFGLTFGLGVALIVHGAGLGLVGRWRAPRPPGTVYRWMLAGGATGAVAISAQWISFDLTTIAVSFTVQQLAVLVVVGLAPVVFDARRERLTAPLLAGTLAVIAGSVMVVWAGA